MDTILRNYINGQWTESHSAKYFPVINPATTRKLAKVPAGCLQDVEEGTNAASLSAVTWQTTPVNQRIQYLHKMKQLLESHIDELAEICTNESGKTFVESKEEIILATEHLEMACSVPLLIQGRYAEGVASGIDEFIIRQPIGVGACITPFNFPVLIAFSFFPYALVCGNTYLVKPSEKVPMTITRIFELFETLELPKGVL
ncbi:MAG: aldehyde dehydrogenase family protein, partial [Bacteroidota bacterium]|nr:aldehyde dehydrogenase family protein [Bacteroidota bacterium]